MKLMIVVGARPNFMKAAPILRAISTHNECVQDSSKHLQPLLVHTGQHYDAAMSESFFVDLNLPKPDVFLGAGSGSHAKQTAEIMKRFEEVFLREYPDVVVVVGDVNSTVACALVTAKISSDGKGIRPFIAHVEAGLRSFDRSMPEECNRVVTDHLSDLLFVTEKSGLTNLEKEGIPSERVFFVGNTMIDSLFALEGKAETSTILERLGLRTASTNGYQHSIEEYALLTLHRPANVDNAESFLEILEGLQDVATLCPIIFPAHPRTQMQIQQHGFESYFDWSPLPSLEVISEHHRNAIRLLEPQGYLDFVCLMKHARVVITDSGGIQEETTCLSVPCVTVRDNTERPVTLDYGTNVLGGTRRDSIRTAIRQQLTREYKKVIPDKWDGNAASRIVEILASSRSTCKVSDAIYA